MADTVSSSKGRNQSHVPCSHQHKMPRQGASLCVWGSAVKLVCRRCLKTLVTKLYLSMPFFSDTQPPRVQPMENTCSLQLIMATAKWREFLNKLKQTFFPCPLIAEELKFHNHHWSTKVFLCWKYKVCYRNILSTWWIDNSFPNGRFSSS